MAILIDHPSKVITVEKIAEQGMTLLQSTPTEIWSLNLNTFKTILGDLSDAEDALPFDYPFSYVAPITVGGVSLAAVLQIINDYTVTFQDGQYAVNLEGLNSNVGDRVNVNQVSVRSANSAGLTFNKQAEDSAYLDGRIWVDTISGNAGNTYPLGTPALPCLSFASAVEIQNNRGLPPRFHGVGTDMAPTGFSLNNFDLLGVSHVVSNFEVETGVTTQATIFENLTLTGFLDGVVTIINCKTLDVSGFKGRMDRTGMNGTITLATDTTAHEFIECYSTVAGDSRPIVDFDNLDNQSAYFRRYAGGIEIRNYSGANNALTIGVMGGKVVLHPSCTGGNMSIRGVAELEDNSTGTVVNKDGLVQGVKLEELWDDAGLDVDNPKTITENTAGVSYDEQANGVSKEVRKVGNTTTIQRQ